MTPVFLTVDTEFAWRHHAAGLDLQAVYRRSIEPAGVGLGHQLAVLARAGLKACFFVDPFPALAYGIEPVRRMVGTVLDAGQEVQLHLHPQWADPARFELWEFDPAGQAALIAQAAALLVEAGAPPPIAFRAGSYAANDATLAALADQGFAYDSSHNGAMAPRWSRTALPARRIAPVAHAGLVEVPVTVIEDAPGRLRTFQLCALSAGEAAAALDHAARHAHAAVTIVSHGFELATRDGLRANRVHARRFAALCAHLAARADVLPTAHFADRPPLALGRDDRPLPPSRWRTARRHAEQLWSNWVEERAA